MPSGTNKKHQLEDILSDKVSIMETDDVSEDAASVDDHDAQPGFCVECKDQPVTILSIPPIAILSNTQHT